MLHHTLSLDKRFWAEAAMTAIYVKNRLPSPKIERTRLRSSIVYKSKPSVKHMRVFGCRTYISDSEGESGSSGDPRLAPTVPGLRRSVQGVSTFMTSRRGRW
ncbi:hypothetical protein Pcac1_g29426 [Phytophthora cactorum]|nr:hypothetical protein Pcac1_g29426 [Phytophthora cactorum]